MCESAPVLVIVLRALIVYEKEIMHCDCMRIWFVCVSLQLKQVPLCISIYIYLV